MSSICDEEAKRGRNEKRFDKHKMFHAEIVQFASKTFYSFLNGNVRHAMNANRQQPRNMKKKKMESVSALAMQKKSKQI